MTMISISTAAFSPIASTLMKGSEVDLRPDNNGGHLVTLRLAASPGPARATGT
jgi:hypothetical protein